MACWWQKVAFTVKRAVVSVTARVKSRKQGGGGLKKLRNDVQTCGYEDVKVMWEMLRRSKTEFETSSPKKQRKRPFRRVFAISSFHHHIRHHHQPAEVAKLGHA